MENFLINCKNVPKIFFEDKNIAKTHFRRFGKIRKMIFKPKSKGCCVGYTSLESVQKAMEFGCMYENQIFEIIKESPMVKRKRTKKNNDPDWVPDPDVAAELDALGGGPSLRLPVKYALRPEHMDVEYTLPERKIAKKQRPVPKRTNSTAPNSNANVISTPEEQELIEIIRKPAFNIDEKYKALDARDKLMRNFLKKKDDTNFGATKGTCPDMCPEKERLLRVIQHQVSMFEQDTAKEMDPNLAVKQYSRSSADQEAPLPHELRPVEVLQMTMSYLVHRIMSLVDSSEVNVGDWFHFLWDRTRSIRKDITQQELCSQGSVELVEQCARFHIHCSARLVAEEPSVFDQKINTENLTKCLQTLKYMYHDLRLKGEECSNEAEFRAYVILLNLNDSNFMWEVQNLHPNIQKSKQVQTAIQIYSALDKNNFIKFFKLINSTTYLNACILMRYFIQVRIRALKILLKCYTPRTTEVVYPLDELTKILGFESESHTVEFLQNCGLTMNSTNTGVVLSKKLFSTPNFNFSPLDRAINIVESKRKNVSVGQIVCGGILPAKSFETHIPEDSFKNDGTLKLDNSGDLEELISSLLKRSVEIPSKIPKPITLTTKKLQGNSVSVKQFKHDDLRVTKSSIFSSTKNENEYSKPANIFGAKNEQIKVEKSQNSNKPIFGFAKSNSSIFGAQPKTTTSIPTFDAKKEIPKPSSSIFGGASTNLNIFAPKTDTFKTPAPFQNIPEKNNTNFNEIKWDLDSPEKKEIQEIFFKKPSPVKSNDIIPKNEFILPNISFKPPSPDKNEMELVRKAEEEKIRKTEQEILRKKLEESKKLIEKEKMRLKEREISRKLEEENRLKRLREKEEELKRTKEIESTVKNLMSEMLDKIEINIRNENIKKLKFKIRRRILLDSFRKWRSTTVKMKRKRKAIDCSPGLFNFRSPKEEAEQLRTNSQDLTLSLMKRYKSGKPSTLPHKDSTILQKINLKNMSNVISKRYSELGKTFFKDIYWKCIVSLPDTEEMPEGKTRIDNVLQQFFNWKNSVFLEQFFLNQVQSVKYCIEKQVGVEVKNYDANGFIFLAKNYNAHLSVRIIENLKNFGILTKIPIVLILQEAPSSNLADFNALIEQGIISNYELLVDNLNPKKLTENIEKGLNFLLKNTEPQPPIELDTMSSFLSRNLGTDIWNKANSFCKWNSMYKKCLQNPGTVISLYNDALSRIKSLILNRACYEFANFPEVFKEFLPSDIPDYLPCDYKYFPSFYKDKPYFKRISNILESLKLEPISWPPENENDLEKKLYDYCKRIFKEPDVPFYKVMSVFLREIEETHNFKSINNILWTKIIEIITLEKLKQTNFSLESTKYKDKSIFNQLTVVYDPEALKEFTNTDWFYVNNPMIKENMGKYSYENIKEKRIFYDSTQDEIESTILKAQNKINSFNTTEVKNEINEFKYLLNDLEESLLINKKITSNFNEKLMHVVEDV